MAKTGALKVPLAEAVEAADTVQLGAVALGGGAWSGHDRHPLRDRRVGLAGAVVIPGKAAVN
jgi:hypothetical protein